MPMPYKTEDLLIIIGAMLSALNSTNGAPESMLYINCDMDMNKWSIIREVMLQSKLINIKSNYVTLTLEGQLAAQAIDAKIATSQVSQ